MSRKMEGANIARDKQHQPLALFLGKAVHNTPQLNRQTNSLCISLCISVGDIDTAKRFIARILAVSHEANDDAVVVTNLILEDDIDSVLQRVKLAKHSHP